MKDIQNESQMTMDVCLQDTEVIVPGKTDKLVLKLGEISVKNEMFLNEFENQDLWYQAMFIHLKHISMDVFTP